ncbi:hypothetical protein CBS101457_006574 [Exobasidium rhododendri]|nr:hypothetical protein CBS101457_006574 [Exobasidium rhododendri]
MPSTPFRSPSSTASVDDDRLSSSPSTSSRSRLQSLAIETLLSSTLSSISSTPPRLPVAKNKEPLSLPTTTKNFRGFVQKSGPIFYFQDSVEATLAWDDWAWTSMWMAIWAFIALHPHLLLCAPTAILSIILIRTHAARFPVGQLLDDSTTSGNTNKAALVTQTPAQALAHAISKPSSTGQGAVRPPLIPNPPHEGTIKYYENLRDIQNMMKLVTDGYDAGAPLVPYLNWSSYRRSLILLQGSLLLTCILFVAGPYVPIRPILLLAGEGAFVINHPWFKPGVEGMKKRIDEEKRTGKTTLGRELNRIETNSREWRATLRQWLEEDGLDDEVWQKGWKDFEMFENERYSTTNAANTGGWSAHNLTFGERKSFTKGSDGWSAQELEVAGFSIDISRQVAMSLEPGWQWVEGDDWRIDWVGLWSTAGVDAEGFLYTDSDWQGPSPFPYGHPNQPKYPPIKRSAHHSFLSDLINNGREEIEEEDFEEEEENDHLTGMEIRNTKAETRRRRWMRRAVYVGKQESEASDLD